MAKPRSQSAGQLRQGAEILDAGDTEMQIQHIKKAAEQSEGLPWLAGAFGEAVEWIGESGKNAWFTISDWTKEKAEEVVNELVKKGEIGQDEGKKLVDDLLKKGEEGKKEIEATVEKTVKNLIEKADISTRKELNELKSEIEQLKEKLNTEK